MVVDAADQLRAVVERSTGTPTGARLATALSELGVRVEHLEASVRGGPDGPIRGGRMMIERSPAEAAAAIADALSVSLGAAVVPLFDAATALGVPLITGWDAATSAVKVYVNASDAARDLREAIGQRIGWGATHALTTPPHLYAVNVGAKGLERKAYVQFGDPERATAVYGEPRAVDLVRRASDRGLVGGAVVSFDVDDGGLVPRAFFLAIRGGAASDVDALLADEPGFDLEALSRALPFPRGHCRSVGIAPGGQWTAYFKPSAADDPVWQLEPVACYRSGGLEIGVHLAPNELSVRAHARTSRYAISFRTRSGHPTREELEPLMRWVVRRVRESEAAGTQPTAALTSPPAPWVLVRE